MSVPSSRVMRIGRPLRSPGAVMRTAGAVDHPVAEGLAVPGVVVGPLAERTIRRR